MANETILVVDADTKSQKVLEVSFKKAGYRVLIVDTIEKARGAITTHEPDLIVSDTQLPDGDGFDFCAEVEEHPHWTNIPFVFLTEQRSLPEKMRGFELGADEYLTKPIYIKEVTSRVEVLLQKRAQQRFSGGEAEEFQGDLADVTMIDLLQTIEQELRSGSIHINRNGRRAAVYFREGNILDAMCGKLQGEEALYRLMLWPDGGFRIEYHDNVRRADHIEKNSGELLIEGIQRLDQWNEIVDTLPALNRVFEADYQRLPALLEALPDPAGRVVRLFDGVRSLREVIDDSPFDDITTLQIIRRLLGEDVLFEKASSKANASEATSNLEAWLAGADDEDDVPTPFSQVDSSVEISPLSDHVADASAEPQRAEGQGDAEGGGHWKVHWDAEEEARQSERDTLEQSREELREELADVVEKAASHAEADADTDAALSELEEREVRRREEEARQLLRQSGRFEATIPQVQAVARDDESKKAAEARDASADESVERRTTTPIETVEHHEETPPAEAKTAHRTRQPTPIATPNGGMSDTEDNFLERSPADTTSPGIQVARLFQDDDEIEEPEETKEEEAKEAEVPQAEAPVEEPVEQESAEQESAEQEASEELPSSAERRAASVEEAASVKREASRSVRESAPFAAVDPNDEPKAEDEGDVVEEEIAEEPDIARPRRVTEEISTVEDDEEIAKPESVNLSADEVTEPIEESSVETDTADEDEEELPVVDVTAAEAPAKVERSAADGKVVKAEYDLSQSPGSKTAESKEEEEAEAEKEEEPEAEKDEAPVEEESEPAAEEEPEAEEEKAEEEKAEEEKPAEKEEEPAAEDDFFDESLADKSHEDAFFSDGEEGDYNWEFEDVPKTSNRWMFFTAVAVIVALTAIVIALATGSNSSDEAEGDAIAASEEEPAQEEPKEPKEPKAPAAEEPQEKLAEKQPEEAEEPEGMTAAQAQMEAGVFGADVQDTATRTAAAVAGVDPAAANQQPVANAGQAGEAGQTAPGAATQASAAANKPPEAEKPKAEKPKKPASSGNSFNDRLASAQRLVNRGRNSQALDALRKLSKEKPGHGKTAYLHGQAALGAGRNGEAIKHLARADRLGYRKASMYLDLATAYQLSGDVAKAKGAYKKFLNLQPSGKRADEVRSILERL